MVNQENVISQSQNSLIPLSIKELCKVYLSHIYQPFDDQSIYKMVSSLFKTLPFVRSFQNLDIDSLHEIIRVFSFKELIREEMFNREEKRYKKKGINGFINFDKHVFLQISSSNENSIESGDDIVILKNSDNIFNESLSLFDLVVYYDNNTEEQQWINDLFKKIEKIAQNIQTKIKKNSINFLCFDHGYHLKNVKIKKSFKGNLELNYGEDFLKVNDHLIKFLDSDETGLAILFGQPGCGKTFFIRYLLSVLNKKVIYIPPHLVNRVAEPDFLYFLLRQNDFILIIEDAEEIITDRKDTQNQNTTGVSNLLSLSDGILGDCIRVKIMVTFNSEISNIDPALLRKGRLKIQHEFKKLNIIQANKLLKYLNIDFKANEPMNLSDIYEFNTDNFRKEKKKEKVGFER